MEDAGLSGTRRRHEPGPPNALAAFAAVVSDSFLHQPTDVSLSLGTMTIRAGILDGRVEEEERRRSLLFAEDGHHGDFLQAGYQVLKLDIYCLDSDFVAIFRCSLGTSGISVNQ